MCRTVCLPVSGFCFLFILGKFFVRAFLCYIYALLRFYFMATIHFLVVYVTTDGTFISPCVLSLSLPFLQSSPLCLCIFQEQTGTDFLLCTLHTFYLFLCCFCLSIFPHVVHAYACWGVGIPSHPHPAPRHFGRQWVCWAGPTFPIPHHHPAPTLPCPSPTPLPPPPSVWFWTVLLYLCLYLLPPIYIPTSCLPSLWHFLYTLWFSQPMPFSLPLLSYRASLLLFMAACHTPHCSPFLTRHRIIP